MFYFNLMQVLIISALTDIVATKSLLQTEVHILNYIPLFSDAFVSTSSSLFDAPDLPPKGKKFQGKKIMQISLKSAKLYFCENSTKTLLNFFFKYFYGIM